MAFGKIAVRTLTGDIEEYEITKPTTSIGRQPGNDIVLPTSAVSRYHAQLDVAEGSVHLVDLGTVNGTYLNDAQLDPNGRIALNDGDVIVIGDMQMRFYSPEARSGLKRAALNLNIEAKVEESPDVPFRLLLDEPQQSVAPGARLQMTLIMENTADYEYPVSIEMRGLEADWAKTNRREAILEPGVQTQAMISVRPPRSSTTKPGIYPLSIRVALKDDPTRAIEAVREIDVVGYAGLGVAMKPGRTTDVYHVAVQNQGNVPMAIKLEGYQREKLLRFRYEPSEFALPAGQTQQVSLQVRPAGTRPFGASQTVPFAVVARSKDGAGFCAPLMNTYTVQPSWPNWLVAAGVPLVVGAGAVIILVLGLLALTGILPLPFLNQNEPEDAAEVPTSTEMPTVIGPTPSLIPTSAAEIMQFRVEQESVIFQQGGEVTLVWDVSNAEKISLFGPDDQPMPLPADAVSVGQMDIPISDLRLGENRFTLTVTGSDGQERSRSVVIITTAPLCTIPEDIDITLLPEPKSALGVPPEAAEAIIMGRTPDSQWVHIAYNDLENLTIRGWVPAAAVTCPDGSLPIQDYTVIPLESAPPPPTPTPRG